MPFDPSTARPAEAQEQGGFDPGTAQPSGRFNPAGGELRFDFSKAGEWAPEDWEKFTDYEGYEGQVKNYQNWMRPRVQRGAEEAVRWGAPAVAAISGVGIPAAVGTTIASELIAQSIHDYGSEYDDLHSYMMDKAGDVGEALLAGGLDWVGMKVADPLVGRAAGWVTNLPKRGFAKLMQVKNYVPGAVEAQRALKKLGLSLTPIEMGATGVANFIEATASSAIFGGGIVSSSRQKSMDIIENALMDHVETMSRSLTRREFGENLMSLMIGSKTLPLQGEVGFLHKLRGALYNKSRELAEPLAKTVSVKPLKDYFKGNLTRSDVLKSLQEVGALFQADAVGAHMVPKQQLFDSLGSPVPNAAQRAEAMLGDIEEVPLAVAMEMKKRLNKIIKRTEGVGEGATAGHVLQKLKSSIDSALDDQPAIKSMFNMADSVYGKTSDLLNAKLQRSFIKMLKDNPGAVGDWMIGANGPKAGAMDKLTAIEDLFSAQGNLLKKEQTALRKAMGKRKLTTLQKDAFEKEVLQPLRLDMVKAATDQYEGNVAKGYIRGTGNFRADKFWGMLTGQNGEFARKIYGNGYEEALNLAKALALKQNAPGGSKVFIQLTQGGMMSSSLMKIAQFGALGGTAAAGGVGWETAMGAAVIFIPPAAMAKVLSNPSYLRMITDGVTSGPGTRPFYNMLNRLTRIGADSATNWQRETVDKGLNYLDFYTNPYKEPDKVPFSDQQQRSGQ